MSWITDLDPRLKVNGGHYNSTTPSMFYKPEYGMLCHTGMAVRGMPQSEATVPTGRNLTPEECKALRAAMAAKRIGQGAIGKVLGRPQGSIGRLLRGEGLMMPGIIEHWKLAVGLGG